MSMSLLKKVEHHLRRHAVAPSRFGRDVAGDPRFVFDLRRGREPRAETTARVIAFIDSRDGASANSFAPQNGPGRAPREVA